MCATSPLASSRTSQAGSPLATACCPAGCVRGGSKLNNSPQKRVDPTAIGLSHCPGTACFAAAVADFVEEWQDRLHDALEQAQQKEQNEQQEDASAPANGAITGAPTGSVSGVPPAASAATMRAAQQAVLMQCDFGFQHIQAPKVGRSASWWLPQPAVSRGKEAGGIVRDLDWLRMADVQAHRQMPRPAPASQPASQQQAAPTW